MSYVYGRIYLVTNTVTSKVYIGQTIKSISARWVNHRSEASAGKSRAIFHYSIRKHGHHVFTVQELATAQSQSELDSLEIAFIKQYNSADRRFGYNLRAGGNGGGALAESTKLQISARNKGKKLSAETISKISAGLTGRSVSSQTRIKISQANRGKIRSLEALHALHESNRGRTASEETRRKQSAALKGRSVSAETRRKIGEAHIGRKASPEALQKNRDKVVSDETRKKLSVSQKARMAYPEVRKRISESLKGKPSPNKGKPMPEHQRLAMIERFRTQGHPASGRVCSEYTKRRIGEANRTRLTGTKASKETRRKMSESQRLRQQDLTPEERKQAQAHRIGVPRSEDIRRRIGMAHKGRIVSAEQRRKISATLTGRHLSEEHKKKLSESGKGKQTGRFVSEETRRRIGEAGKGRPKSEETLIKLREASLEYWRKRKMVAL